jgi:hypothetical protein
MTPYHTALGDRPAAGAAVDFYEGRRGIVFQADLSNGIPLPMYSADVWYADLPWRDGYQRFADRAGVNPKLPFAALMELLGGLIANAQVPAVMVTGKHAVKHLRPYEVSQAKLNGAKAVACLWGIRPWEGVLDATEILAALSQEYDCVGDFCCGYGRSGEVFSRAGKRYVLSDLNASCVGEIASLEPTWQ